MGNRIRAVMIVMLCLAPLSGQAMTGQQLYDKCQAAVQQPPASEPSQQAVTRLLDAGTCAGFVGGVVSGINLVGGMMLQQKIVDRNFICVPEGKHSQHLLRELLEHLQDNTDDRELPGQLVIYKVFGDRYRCSAEGE